MEADASTPQAAHGPLIEKIVGCALPSDVRDTIDLDGTGARWIKALAEMTRGYGAHPAKILATRFHREAHVGLIIVRDIEFTSICRHHLLPFMGTATVGYEPSHPEVVGLSKLARLVGCFAERLQIQ